MIEDSPNKKTSIKLQNIQIPENIQLQDSSTPEVTPIFFKESQSQLNIGAGDQSYKRQSDDRAFKIGFDNEHHGSHTFLN